MNTTTTVWVIHRPAKITNDEQMKYIFLVFLENYRGVQAQGRRAVRSTESEMDEMDAQIVLSMLFWSFVSHSKSGVSVSSVHLFRVHRFAYNV